MSPDDIERQFHLAIYNVHMLRRRDRWNRSATIATWCLVVVGALAACGTMALSVIALLTYLSS